MTFFTCWFKSDKNISKCNEIIFVGKSILATNNYKKKTLDDTSTFTLAWKSAKNNQKYQIKIFPNVMK